MTRTQLRVRMVQHLVQGHEKDNGRVSVRYITRVLTAEKELFTQHDVLDAVAYAKHCLGADDDCHNPFIAVDDQVRYCGEDEDDSTRLPYCCAATARGPRTL